jgi:hypothetical protein
MSQRVPTPTIDTALSTHALHPNQALMLQDILQSALEIIGPDHLRIHTRHSEVVTNKLRKNGQKDSIPDLHCLTVSSSEATKWLQCE